MKNIKYVIGLAIVGYLGYTIGEIAGANEMAKSINEIIDKEIEKIDKQMKEDSQE